MTTTEKLDYNNLPKHEIDHFVSLAKELQLQALSMEQKSTDEFTKDFYMDIFKLAVSAERNAIEGKMTIAWKQIGRIINRGIISETAI